MLAIILSLSEFITALFEINDRLKWTIIDLGSAIELE